ncbi:hypothetical protein JCM9743_37370 [Natrinema sp. JCM 9743]
MDALITGESERIGLSIIDNNDVEHLVEMGSDGEINYHEVEEYANDPAGRTPEETEHGNQARRFAKWHVYRERGYETLPRYKNPDAIVGAMMAVGATPPATVDEYFGEFIECLRLHDADRTTELPVNGIDPADIIAYRQDLYVEPDPLEQEPPMTDRFAEYFSDPAQTLENVFGDVDPSLEDLTALVQGDAELAVSLPEFEIEAVSDVHYLHGDRITAERTTGDGRHEREPDASLELLPLDPEVFDSTRELLFSHLGNQVRDCYLLMGCEPPSVFQQQGLGTVEGTRKQQMYNQYEEYYSTDSPVSSWKPGNG